MDTQKRIISVVTLLFALSWISPAISSYVPVKPPAMDGVMGMTVDAIGSMNGVGYTNSYGATKYYIPLNEKYNGTYGVGDLCYGRGAGRCSDTGQGSGYDHANALTMNLVFNLAGIDKNNALLNIWFEDLDLAGANDPYGFFESVKASNGLGHPGTGVINNSGAIPTSDKGSYTWILNLASLGPLEMDGDKVWVQLGFGSYAKYHAYNTSEYLKASVVPVPAAIWLFGTALIGFVGMSRRTKVA
jgi:hypothetical protein